MDTKPKKRKTTPKLKTTTRNCMKRSTNRSDGPPLDRIVDANMTRWTTATLSNHQATRVRIRICWDSISRFRTHRLSNSARCWSVAKLAGPFGVTSATWILITSSPILTNYADGHKKTNCTHKLRFERKTMKIRIKSWNLSMSPQCDVTYCSKTTTITWRYMIDPHCKLNDLHTLGRHRKLNVRVDVSNLANLHVTHWIITSLKFNNSHLFESDSVGISCLSSTEFIACQTLRDVRLWQNFLTPSWNCYNVSVDLIFSKVIERE